VEVKQGVDEQQRAVGGYMGREGVSGVIETS
jgi:hypothetical protein